MQKSRTPHENMTPSELDDLYIKMQGEAKTLLLRPCYDRLVEGSKLIQLRRREAMIDAGKFDPNIYIVKNGMVRLTYMDNNLERTRGFAMPGTLLISYHSYYGDAPSFYRFEAVVPSVVVKISKENFDKLIKEDQGFAFWLLQAAQNHIYYEEIKNKNTSGEAKNKLIQLMQDWPEIFTKVPAKIIASYMGITEVHLSRIKAELFRNKKFDKPAKRKSKKEETTLGF